MTHTPTHDEAQDLLNLVARPRTRRCAPLQMQVRSYILGIESRYEDPAEHLEILKSFFRQVSLSNISLLIVAEICCPFFPRLDKEGKLPHRELEEACLQEDAVKLRKIVEAFEVDL